MDYFQGVVTEYLRCDRSVFVNTECRIELDDDDSRTQGRHWYCDVMACCQSEKTIYLCEVTYASDLKALVKRLCAWQSHWSLLKEVIIRDCGFNKSWQIEPWAFIPQKKLGDLKKKFLPRMRSDNDDKSMPIPYFTPLESVCPWNYEASKLKISDQRERLDLIEAAG